MEPLCRVKMGFNEIEVFADKVVMRDFFKREKSVMIKQITTLKKGFGKVEIETTGGQKIDIPLTSKKMDQILAAISEAQKRSE